MAAIALDMISPDVMARLKKLASDHQSDIEAEALQCLERGLSEREIVEAELKEIRALREETKGAWLTDEFIRAARDEGRS